MNVAVAFFGTLVMATGVLLAAVGAHLVTGAETADVWRSANLMQFIHGIGLLLLAFSRHWFIRPLAVRLWQLSVWLMVVGIFLFCLTLYLRGLGAVLVFPGWFAPFGGVSFCLSWLSLGAAIICIKNGAIDDLDNG